MQTFTIPTDDRSAVAAIGADAPEPTGTSRRRLLRLAAAGAAGAAAAASTSQATASACCQFTPLAHCGQCWRKRS